MRKPTGPTRGSPAPPGQLEPEGERPIGEIVGDLVADGKAYARAEFNVVKTIAASKASGLKAPLALLGAAMLVGMAALNALAVAVFIMLALVMRPLFAGLLAFVLIAAVAAFLGMLGVRKLRQLP